MKTITPLEFEKPLVELEKMLAQLRERAGEHKIDAHDEIQRLEEKLIQTRREIYQNLTPWQRVRIVRHPARPYALDYIQAIASEFHELHGDRQHGDDRAIVSGLATIGKHKLAIIGQQKGRDTKDNILRNFGCPHPEGYRKALRIMKMADKFKLPILCLIDTPGAYPGVGSEERHVAEAIAVNIREMFDLAVPILAIVIGEGGSGGALGIGVADRVLIMENGYYSVISPEGCAGILWKDRAYAPQAAEALKLTARDLLERKLVEEIIPEPEGGAHRNPKAACEALGHAVKNHLDSLCKTSPKQLMENRMARFRSFGIFEEEQIGQAAEMRDQVSSL